MAVVQPPGQPLVESQTTLAMDTLLVPFETIADILNRSTDKPIVFSKNGTVYTTRCGSQPTNTEIIAWAVCSYQKIVLQRAATVLSDRLHDLDEVQKILLTITNLDS